MAAPTNINNQVRFSPQPLMQQHSQQPMQQQHQQHTNPMLPIGSSQPYSFFTGLGDPNHTFTPPFNISSSSNPMNDYYDQNINQTQPDVSQTQTNNNNMVIGSHIADQSKSLSSLTVADLVQILQPIQTSVQELKSSVDKQLGLLQNKVNVMEGQLKKEMAKNDQLTGIIVNMQKCLNQIDSDKRITNLMINGLPEEEMMDDQISLPTDKEKFHHLLQKIGINDLEQSMEQFQFSRIGERTNNGRNRLLKINVGSKEIRDKICNESKKVKLLPEPWKMVYINKDVHPVYLKENQRIRKKMAELKRTPGFEHETGRVKLENGVLMVDGRQVDQNLFLI